MGAGRINLGLVADIPDTAALGLAPKDGNDRVIAIKRDGKLFLWKNDCPHNHRPLELKRHHFLSPEGTHITCFAHAAHFQLETGFCFSGPCYGKSLTPVRFSIVDDEIWAEL